MEPQRLQATISAAQAGSAQAYELLLAEYGPRLYGYFARALGRHQDAEDMLSEMALRLVKSLKSYDDRGKFEPWLFRMAANLIRDRIRRRRAAPPTVSLSSESPSARSLAEELPGRDDPVDFQAISGEASEALQAALAKLDATTREMILLRHFGDMSFREIADMYQCPLGTALARVHRGLKALRKMMGGDDGNE